MAMNKTLDKSAFKVVFVGDSGTGKTTFLLRHLNGGFREGRIPTIGVDVLSLEFNTNYGHLVFNCWDCGGLPENIGLQGAYYAMADACVVFFDVSDDETASHVAHWCRDLPPVSTAICGNKIDLQVGSGKRKVRYYLDKHPDVLYYDVGTKSKYNFDWPFLGLARKLTGRQDLVFTTP